MAHSWRVMDGSCIYCGQILIDAYNKPCIETKNEKGGGYHV